MQIDRNLGYAYIIALQVYKDIFKFIRIIEDGHYLYEVSISINRRKIGAKRLKIAKKQNYKALNIRLLKNSYMVDNVAGSSPVSSTTIDYQRFMSIKLKKSAQNRRKF